MKPTLGAWGESKATDYCKSLGWTILERNWRDRFGEGDIIAEDNNSIVLVEVKTKSTTQFGDPVEMITPAKQRKLRNLALRLTQAYNKPVRIDVMTILQPPSGDPIVRHYLGAVGDK
jgi:putative endonuclease